LNYRDNMAILAYGRNYLCTFSKGKFFCSDSDHFSIQDLWGTST